MKMKVKEHRRMTRSTFCKMVALFLGAALLLSSFILPVAAEASQVKPETWAAVDGLGRTVNEYKDVGETREGKYVGIFYWTWHYEFAKSTKAHNVTEIMAQYPDARNDYNHDSISSGISRFSIIISIPTNT